MDGSLTRCRCAPHLSTRHRCAPCLSALLRCISHRHRTKATGRGRRPHAQLGGPFRSTIVYRCSEATTLQPSSQGSMRYFSSAWGVQYGGKECTHVVRWTNKAGMILMGVVLEVVVVAVAVHQSVERAEQRNSEQASTTATHAQHGAAHMLPLIPNASVFRATVAIITPLFPRFRHFLTACLPPSPLILQSHSQDLTQLETCLIATSTTSAITCPRAIFQPTTLWIQDSPNRADLDLPRPSEACHQHQRPWSRRMCVLQRLGPPVPPSCQRTHRR